MIVNSKKMAGVPVRTEAGFSVGKVVSFDLDGDTGKLTVFRVRIPGAVPALLDQEAMISWSQIVSMSDQEVVVVDAVVREMAAAKANPRMAAPPAHLSQTES